MGSHVYYNERYSAVPTLMKVTFLSLLSQIVGEVD